MNPIVDAMISLRDIKDAREDLARFVECTPLAPSSFLSSLGNCTVNLKLENLQITNSFKIRGAFNRLLHLSVEEKGGIITASAGNHGQAVAYAARKLGFFARIVVPETTPQVKIDGIKRYGADLVLFGDTYDEAEAKAK